MKITRQKTEDRVSCGGIPKGEIFEYLGDIYMAIDAVGDDIIVSDKGGGLCAVNLETGYVVGFDRYDKVRQLTEYDDYEFICNVYEGYKNENSCR